MSVRLSVVVPVRNSHHTIRACIDSLLSQSVRDLEVIVVGDRDDTSWGALDDLEDERLVCIGLDIHRDGAIRDANLKRCCGLEHASGQYIALTDSDMTLPGTWAETGLALLQEQDVVGGGMFSESHGFVARYVDTNRIAAKTPRTTKDYLLTHLTYGRPGFKPPITASLFMARKVYEAVGGPDPMFTRSYEDYEWARRIIDAGFSILMTARVSGFHRHRTDMLKLVGEYRRSGKGASDYVMKHRHCHFARARLRHAAIFATMTTLVMLGVIRLPLDTLETAGLLTLVLGMWSVVRVRRFEAVTYPLVTLLLGSCYWTGLIGGLLRHGRPRPGILGTVILNASIDLTNLVPTQPAPEMSDLETA